MDVTAIETSMNGTIQLNLHKNYNLTAPIQTTAAPAAIRTAANTRRGPTPPRPLAFRVPRREPVRSAAEGSRSSGKPSSGRLSSPTRLNAPTASDPPNPATDRNPTFDGLWERYERRKRRYEEGFQLDSRLYRFLSDRWKLLRYALRDMSGEATEVESGGELDVAQTEEAWELSFALLRRQREVAEAHGARFAILVVPDQVQVEPDVRVFEVPPVLWTIQERVAAFARAEGIRLVEPLAEMRALREQDGEPHYHRIDRHWNRLGHRRMAEVLDRELRTLGVL